MTSKSCGNCNHRVASQCFRYPPQMVLWPNDNQHPVLYAPYPTRPDVAETTLACGEWKEKPHE